MWDKDTTAQAAYDGIRDVFGQLPTKDVAWLNTQPKPVLVQKNPRAVEIRPVNSASQSLISYATL
jgi:hypothetical protein